MYHLSMFSNDQANLIPYLKLKIPFPLQSHEMSLFPNEIMLSLFSVEGKVIQGLMGKVSKCYYFSLLYIFKGKHLDSSVIKTK